MTTPQPSNQLPEEVKQPYKISEREPVLPAHYPFGISSQMPAQQLGEHRPAPTPKPIITYGLN